ncbi:MAG: hypothetical protein AB1333_01475 [Patescibacteria group bacterium]
MNSEAKQCQNCKNSFTIAPEDFDFYEKIKVPAPTWCPPCRFQRRLSFCNERHLYKNTCSLCGKNMIAMYPPGTSFPLYCLECYRSDKWDPISYGREYNFDKPFFEQFKEMKMRVPRASLIRQGDIVGSEYCNRASYNKDCYLLIRANYNENSRYSYLLWNSRDCADCFNADKSELAYQSIDINDCYNVQYCQECKQCRDSYFLFDCRNCTNCIACAGLRNAQYSILNKQYTKEEYEKKIKELDLDTAAGLQKLSERFSALVAGTIHQSVTNINSTDVSGNWLNNCNRVKDSYQSREVENGKYLLSIFEAKDCMDYSYWGRATELVYETSNCGYNVSNIRFANETWDSCHDLTYVDNCYSSSNLFGCIGLKSKEYCILNKQYTKEEYEALVPKIIEHMNAMPYKDKQGREYKFGEFYPPDLSTSAYNTTAAYDHFPMTKEEAQKVGYVWEDPQEKEHVATKSYQDLPERISSIGDDILNEIISCETWEKRGSLDVTAEHNCTKAFRIIPEELAFYRRMNIPLPRKCPNTRHFERFNKRNPMKLWHRACQCTGEKSENGIYQNTAQHQHGTGRCPNEFETSYAPERKEIVYCEQCYQAEVV